MVRMSEGFSTFHKRKTKELISYAKIHLGLKIYDQTPKSLTFEEGIDNLARSLNSMKYVYTTSSCGGHLKDVYHLDGNAPYIWGTVWLGYATRFLEGIITILREKRLSMIELVISTPSRKRDYFWFRIKCSSAPINEDDLERRRKDLERLAKGVAKLARKNPDPVWFDLLQKRY